jgi:hypothetical protein
MPLLAIAVVVCVVCAIASGSIAQRKGLNAGGFFLAGLLLGFIGLLLAVAAQPRHAPGWYTDPSQQAPLRWWDGHAWSEQTHA